MGEGRGAGVGGGELRAAVPPTAMVSASSYLFMKSAVVTVVTPAPSVPRRGGDGRTRGGGAGGGAGGPGRGGVAGALARGQRRGGGRGPGPPTLLKHRPRGRRRAALGRHVPSSVRLSLSPPLVFSLGGARGGGGGGGDLRARGPPLRHVSSRTCVADRNAPRGPRRGGLGVQTSDSEGSPAACVVARLLRRTGSGDSLARALPLKSRGGRRTRCSGGACRGARVVFVVVLGWCLSVFGCLVFGINFIPRGFVAVVKATAVEVERLNTQHSTLDTQPSTLNPQHSTLDTQHSTLSTQHFY